MFVSCDGVLCQVLEEEVLLAIRIKDENEEKDKRQLLEIDAQLDKCCSGGLGKVNNRNRKGVSKI